MKFNALRPILWTEKLEETIGFYTQTLGFTIVEQNNEWSWASLFKDGIEIMLSRPNEHIPFEKPFFTGSFYFDTDNVDQLWEQLKLKARICYEIENFPWEMREFAIYDNNGYILQFGQQLGLSNKN